jgi:hypothetical protein
MAKTKIFIMSLHHVLKNGRTLPDFLILEDGTIKLFRNFGKELPLLATNSPENSSLLEEP